MRLVLDVALTAMTIGATTLAVMTMVLPTALAVGIMNIALLAMYFNERY
jgi:hypothetical protein